MILESQGKDQGSRDPARPPARSWLENMRAQIDYGRFSESDIDAEDYVNVLLSPARPRRYLERLGIEPDSEPGEEDEDGDRNNDSVDRSPLRRRPPQPSARPRRGRRGPAPELAVFHAQDPVWNGDLDACALTDRDKATLREFWTKLDNDQMEYCSRCRECWFQMEIDYDGICSRCYRKDEKRGPDEPYFFSAENQLDFGPVPARLPELTPTEESLIARVHVHVNIMLVRGQQYKYRGHVVHFLREVGLVYNQLPLLPRELNTVLLRPANTSSHANLSRQFTRQFRVRRQAVMIWLDYLRHHHPGYRCIVIDEERLSQLPEDGNAVDAIPQSQVEAADVGPEEDQEAEPELEDAAAVPDLLAKDTELDALRSVLAPRAGQHGLRLPNIRHTPINEFNRSHALLSLAFPCLFPDGRADFVEPRLRSIEYKDYIEHAMRWHDGRFARHPTFRFVAFNTLMRSQARARSRFFVKQHDGTREQLTREQLIQALEHSEDPEAQALINSITRKRQDLEAYAYSLGCPGAFITFSPADLHWRSLYQHMPRYGEWLRVSEPERMALSRYLLRQNPHIAAFHFYRRYCFFRDIVLRKKFNVTDYWDRYEWQGRGSPHNHGLYWMKEGPAADMEDEAARDLFARTWGFHITAVNPEPQLAAVIRKEGKSYYIFEAARNDSLMNHFNPAIILGWLANIDISPCTSLQAVITAVGGDTISMRTTITGEVGTNELQAEDDEFVQEVHDEPIAEEDWHELAHMLPDRPLEEEDIDVLGRRNIDVNYDWTPHVGRYTNDDILSGNYWEQRKAESSFHLDVEHQPLEARDALNPEQRIVYDTVMGHFLAQDRSQLLLHVDGGGGTGKSYLINLLSAHLQAATRGRGTPVWRAAPTGVAGNQISGTTLHSLLHLPINKDFRPLSAIDKAQLQKKLKDIQYLIIDEKSMLGLRMLSWIDDRLREAFPHRNEEFFGGLNVLLVGDFFQLPPVLQKPLYYDKEVQGVEIKGRNAYMRFDKTVFLSVVQRQCGDDQAAFRKAKLDDQEVARFADALRVYATKDRVIATNVGPGATAAPDDKPVGLCNGARDPPCVIMMEFDKYTGPVFLTTADGRKIVPILPSITEDTIVTDLSCRDFQTGLSYVAVSRVKTLQGLMLDAPFDRNHLTYASPPEGIKMKMRDQQLRKRQVLTQNPYKTGHGHT
ncbi:PIF1-like helicase domain-containing protein [Hirsutella rhossiliensis]|uniref:ATP-dependent DNA helicase n=1 Tax=Hirsutella rhossiliensis TaxID=111463 RepID=A0A9P8SH64_9HYPO|nr:PIF1-like helicase domain-containing protein [Hirsutella rhossiliensis]KAH0961205.1 PIF1-like helicase domain-containing protein [Hirsutella rhossiliensis]